MLPVFVPNLWDVKVPPRVHFFLWLLSKNKALTRDNLAKRRNVADPSCLFCSEKETCQHLFFECVVAKQMWKSISQAVDFDIGASFESIGTCWLSNKRFLIVNMCAAAALWGLWKLRNDFLFSAPGLAKHGCFTTENRGPAPELADPLPPSKKEVLKEAIETLSRLGKSPELLTY